MRGAVAQGGGKHKGDRAMLVKPLRYGQPIYVVIEGNPVSIRKNDDGKWADSWGNLVDVDENQPSFQTYEEAFRSLNLPN